MLSKIKIICAVGIVGAILVLGLMLKNKTAELESTCKLLDIAELKVAALEEDNRKLIVYNTQKAEELKKVQDDYKKLLEKTPSDKCGDAFPSVELLEFLKENSK